MSAEEREQELVTGVVGGIIQKGPDKWQVEVTPPNSQYARKLWTKSATQHDALVNLIGQPASILCNVSHWEKDGKPIRSLWVDQIGGDDPTTLPEAARPAEGITGPQDAKVGDVASTPSGLWVKADADPRQTSIERQTALKTAVELLIGLGPVPENVDATATVIKCAERFMTFLQTGEDTEIPF